MGPLDLVRREWMVSSEVSYGGKCEFRLFRQLIQKENGKVAKMGGKNLTNLTI